MWDLADDVHAARGEVRANSQELPPAVASKRLFQVRGLQRLHEALNWVPAPSAHLRPLALAVRHDLRKARVATRSVASGRRRGPAGLELAAAGRSPSDKWLAASDRRQEATAAGRAGSKRRASWDGHQNRSARRQQARRRRAWSRERRCHHPGRGHARSRSSNCPTPDPAPAPRGTRRARGLGRICNDKTAKKAGAPAAATTFSREQQAVSRAAAASNTGRQRPASWLSPRPPVAGLAGSRAASGRPSWQRALTQGSQWPAQRVVGSVGSNSGRQWPALQAVGSHPGRQWPAARAVGSHPGRQWPASAGTWLSSRPPVGG